MSILYFILHRTVDHRLVKTIGQFVYLTVQVNLKCKWDSREKESIKCGTIGIKPNIAAYFAVAEGWLLLDIG